MSNDIDPHKIPHRNLPPDVAYGKHMPCHLDLNYITSNIY